MDHLKEHLLIERNQKIINAVIEKEKRVCPGALALIGIYGSFMTGDYHEKSDLDLLVLINDDRGYQLASCFIQDDLQVAHDIYCTSWESLQQDARYEHPNISKLMDAQIVYCADEKYKTELEKLRRQVRDRLAAPFDREDYDNAEKMLLNAEHCYTRAVFAKERSDVLDWAGGVLYYIENGIAMLNKQYFHYGVKSIYEELNAMKNRPEHLCQLIDQVVRATSVNEVKSQLSVLVRETVQVFDQVKQTVVPRKEKACRDNLTGTYEEMYSNWRNKIYLAADTGNAHLSFMSLSSADHMLKEIYENVDIDIYDGLKEYDPQDLVQTARSYVEVTDAYLREYGKAGIQEKRYGTVDEFIADYQRGKL